MVERYHTLCKSAASMEFNRQDTWYRMPCIFRDYRNERELQVSCKSRSLSTFFNLFLDVGSHLHLINLIGWNRILHKYGDFENEKELK